MIQLLFGREKVSSFDVEKINIRKKMAQSTKFVVGLVHMNVEVLDRLVAFPLDLHGQRLDTVGGDGMTFLQEVIELYFAELVVAKKNVDSDKKHRDGLQIFQLA